MSSMYQNHLERRLKEGLLDPYPKRLIQQVWAEPENLNLTQSSPGNVNAAGPESILGEPLETD